MHGGEDATERFERYVTDQLSAEDRRNFEQHLMECPECFEGVQEMERLVAGIRHAAAEGLLDRPRAWRLWLAPAFAVLCAAGLVAACVSIFNLTRMLDATRLERDAIAQQLRQANTAAARPAVELTAGNLPLLILQASRAQTEQVLTLNPSAREFALWIEVAPANGSFAIEVSTAEDRPIDHAAGLQANRYGAVAAILPAEKLPPGHYMVRLFSENPRRLAGQYLFRIASEQTP